MGDGPHKSLDTRPAWKQLGAGGDNPEFSPQLNSADIGARLRLAREAAGITQAKAAPTIDASRTTLIAIEKGQRRIRTGELQRLAKLYDTSVNALLRREAVHIDLVPRFRRHFGSGNDALNAAAQLLENLVKAEVELENILGIKRSCNYPPERPLLSGDAQVQAEINATELRHWLGLGLAPVREPLTLLELELGIRVYIRRLDSRVSGLFAYDEDVGACMLLNGNHTRERRNESIVHELGHFVSTRRTPEFLHAGTRGRSRSERYADAFGRAFLTPARTVMLKFQEITAGSSRLTRRHVILLAHVFGVTHEAMVRRLEELRLAKRGAWDWFQDQGGITNAQARSVLGDPVTADSHEVERDRPTTLRLSLLAEEAWRQELLSEGQLARLLHLDRVALRRVLDDAASEGIEMNGQPELS